MTCRNKIDKKSKSVTDQQTDGRTDKAGCRVACTRLINIVMESTCKTEADDSCVVFPLLRNFIFVSSHVLYAESLTLTVLFMPQILEKL